jgi:hypothetical protein
MAALALLTGGGGCSFMFADRPPAHHESLPYFDCTSSRLYPVVDLALAGLVLPATISASTDPSDGSAQAAVTVAALAGVALASSIHGFAVTDRCIEAKQALAARLNAPAWPPAGGLP